jgi:PAS domain S-box-containing protein
LRRGGLLVVRDLETSVTFTVDLEAIPRTMFPPFDDLPAESMIEVTGASKIIRGGDGTPRNVTLFIASSDDVQVVSGPPWWNHETAQMFLVATGIALLFTVAWLLTLRQRVATKTRALEELLQKERKLEHRYRALFEGNPHPMWAFDLETLRFLDVNQAAELHYGWSRDEFLQLTVRDILAPEQMTASRRQPTLFDPWNNHIIQHHRKRNGEEIDVEIILHTMQFSGRSAAIVLANDVTQRLRAEAELRASQEQFATVFRATPDSIMIVRVADEKILEVNPAFEELFEWTRDELIGKTSSELGLWADSEQRNSAIAQMRLTGNIRNLEYDFKSKSGRAFTGFSSAEVITYGGEKCFLSVTRDITDRKKAEDALRYREASLAAAQHIASLGSWEADLHSPIDSGTYDLRWSDEVYRIFGFEPGSVEINEEFLFARVPSQDRDRLENAFRQAIQERTSWELEHRIIRPDGSIRQVRVFAQITFDERSGRPLRMQGVVQDITDKKMAEIALQETRDRLNAVLSSLEDAVWSTSPDGQTVLYANPASAIIYGCAESDFNPWSGHVLSSIHADDREKISSLLFRLQNESSVSEEYRIIRTESETRWFRLRARLMSNAEGNPLRIDGITTDITDSKTAEAERRQFEVQLQQTQKLESLGILAGGIAHDFNNLLTAVIGYLTLSKMELPSDTKIHRFLTEAEHASQRAADLARQMLAYSGRGKFVSQRVALGQVFDDMNPILRVSVSRNTELTFNHEKNVPAIEVDVTQLRQIILNLVINASDSLGEAGGSITISTGVSHCTEEFLASTWLKLALPAGDYCYLDVTDSGCGIAEDKLARIFDPFFTTKFTGRGLGLSAVLGIVRGHHGAIDVKSTVGKGTSFRVYFPASAQSAQPILQPKHESNRTWQVHGLALLVDDDASVLQVGKSMLERLGFQVLTACDGLEAIKIYQQRADEIQIVILDLTMPNLDGQQTLKELRQIRVDAPVLLSSGYTEHDVMRRLAGSRYSGFVPKPYSVENLMTVLQSVLHD